jgi:hypothetical protein
MLKNNEIELLILREKNRIQLDELTKVIKNRSGELPVDIMGKILSYHEFFPCNNIEDCIQWFIIALKIKIVRRYVNIMICNYFKHSVSGTLFYALSGKLFTFKFYKSPSVNILGSRIPFISDKETTFIYNLISITVLHIADKLEYIMSNLLRELNFIHDIKTQNNYLFLLILGIIKFCNEDILKIIHKSTSKPLFLFFSETITHHYAQSLIFEHSKKYKKLLFKDHKKHTVTELQVRKYFESKLKQPLKQKSYVSYFSLFINYDIPQKNKSVTRNSIIRCNNIIKVHKNRFDKRRFSSMQHYKRKN